jgi:hypothetical protein
MVPVSLADNVIASVVVIVDVIVKTETVVVMVVVGCCRWL